MDDGAKSSSGLKLSTNSFSYTELELLCFVLKNKYSLSCSIQSTGVKYQWVIYIKAESMQNLNKLVKPYFVKSMNRKLHL